MPEESTGRKASLDHLAGMKVGGNAIHVQRGSVGRCVAIIYDPSEPAAQVNPRITATARLFAASADLLAACEALPLSMLDREGNLDAAEFVDHSEDFMRAMRLARAAIAKARAV